MERVDCGFIRKPYTSSRKCALTYTHTYTHTNTQTQNI